MEETIFHPQMSLPIYFLQSVILALRDRRQKNFSFLSRLCLLRGAGGQDKYLRKIDNFQTKVCCFKL